MSFHKICALLLFYLLRNTHQIMPLFKKFLTQMDTLLNKHVILTLERNKKYINLPQYFMHMTLESVLFKPHVRFGHMHVWLQNCLPWQIGPSVGKKGPRRARLYNIADVKNMLSRECVHFWKLILVRRSYRFYFLA